MAQLATLGTARAAWLVARKELLTSFRDRQTTLYAVVLPIALYPLLFWLMIQGFLIVEGRKEHTRVGVVLAAESEGAVDGRLIEALESDPSAREGPPSSRNQVDVERAAGALDARDSRALLESPRDAARAPDAVLWLASPSRSDDTARSQLYFDSTQHRSSIAKDRVSARLPAHVDAVRAEAAGAAGLSPSDLDPIVLEPACDVSPERDRGAHLLSFLLPMFLVTMAVMGAFYPAVDLTAGERERKTAETTLLLPVPRRSVLQGKILAVCAAAVIATSLNLLALGLSAGHLIGMMGAGKAFQIELPVSAFVAIAPLALLFAFFVSAVLTSAAGFARTFKEGQALLGPVQLLFILPAMAGAIPGIELTKASAFVPVVNVVLAFRALLKGESRPVEYAITALVLLALAVAATWIALRLLDREEIVETGRKSSVRSVLASLVGRRNGT